KSFRKSAPFKIGIVKISSVHYRSFAEQFLLLTGKRNPHPWRMHWPVPKRSLFQQVGSVLTVVLDSIRFVFVLNLRFFKIRGLGTGREQQEIQTQVNPAVIATPKLPVVSIGDIVS
uniref:Uncharacterized protein n=1 Tax=Aegilops tauschii subsp. strangulata TaxID=200361 RepID=A0A453GIX0_AEGTS